MAKSKSTVTPSPSSLARFRQVENLRPGGWWLGTYEDDRGSQTEMWTQINVIMEGENIITGRRVVRVFGTCLDGEGAELHVYRGTQVQSLTERDGNRCGLTIAAAPDEPTETTP